jgi:hypothetical protein
MLDESTALIPSVSRNYQLLQKAESFVSRRKVKTRDAVDMRLICVCCLAKERYWTKPCKDT